MKPLGPVLFPHRTKWTGVSDTRWPARFAGNLWNSKPESMFLCMIYDRTMAVLHRAVGVDDDETD